MEASVTEIAPDIFRISMYPPGSPVSFGCFLVRDDEPAMVETSFNHTFDLVHDAVRRLIDPSKLRYLINRAIGREHHRMSPWLGADRRSAVTTAHFVRTWWATSPTRRSMRCACLPGPRAGRSEQLVSKKGAANA